MEASGGVYRDLGYVGGILYPVGCGDLSRNPLQLPPLKWAPRANNLAGSASLTTLPKFIPVSSFVPNLGNAGACEAAPARNIISRLLAKLLVQFRTQFESTTTAAFIGECVWPQVSSVTDHVRKAKARFGLRKLTADLHEVS